MDSIKKVAFFVTSLNSGGIENYLLRFLQFSKGQLQATIYCKSGSLGDLEQEYLATGAKIKPLRLTTLNLYNYYKLYKKFKKNNYDTVVDFTGNFAALPLLTAKKANIKNRIVFYRGSTDRFKKDVLRTTYNNYLNKLIPKVSTTVLSNSQAAFNFFFNNYWKSNSKFKVIYNGINAKTFLTTTTNLKEELNIPKNAFVIGHVGRFNVAKNHKTIIKVAIELCKENSNNYFVFCGNNVMEGLKEQVAKHNLQKQIKLLGFRKDIIKVLNTLNCFYFPSLTEGQPNALIEAMVAGLPFVASNIAPIKETVSENLHCQLIAPNDHTLAVTKILEIKQKNNNSIFNNLGKIVSEKFDANHLFNQFYKQL
ncbi:glycosyltransferase [Polaribacter aestuariivivens]|uniref:glycosyltransferase n=1 Tax=Polaribacter aestuariivivens TaxID=2304626 RepID=UPI003F4992B3